MINPRLHLKICILLFIFTFSAISSYGEIDSYISGGSSELINDNQNPSNVGGTETDPPTSNSPSTGQPPSFVDFVVYDTVILCVESIVYDTLVAVDGDAGQVVTISILDGPGNLSSIPGNPALGFYSYQPESEGAFEVTFMAQDNTGDSTIVTKTYYVEVNITPVITTTDTSFIQCYGGVTYTVDVDAVDPDDDDLLFYLLSGGASIDHQTGVITFWADAAGEYCHTVVVTDGCSSDTATVCVTLIQNTPPVFDNADLLFTMCPVDTICFDITAFDADPGDSVDIIQIAGPGIFTMNSSGAGTTCFLPDNVDSADYVFIYQAMDNCIRENYSKHPDCPPPVLDTVIVTVVQGEVVSLECPNDTSLYICGPDTLCFPVGDIPSGARVKVMPPSAWFDEVNDNVCFYTNCAVVKEIDLIVKSDCGSDTCNFTVTVSMNSDPLVIMPQDTSLELCEPEEICLPAGITDVDNNIANVTVSPVGYYNDVTGQICFTPDTSGTYKIIVTAQDDCGGEGSDSVFVTVDLNGKPVVEIQPDTTIFLCTASAVCQGASVYDVDDNIVSIVPNLGTYSGGYICFTPDTSGVYMLILSATDECGAYGADTGYVTIDLNSPPEVTSADDFELMLCTPEEVCLDVDAFDIDGNLHTISSNIGTYYPETKQICFMAGTAGTYEIIVTAVDSCNAVDIDTTVVTVMMGNDAELVCWIDPANIFLCEPQEMCFNLEYSPVDAVLSTSFGSIVDGQLCLMFDTTGMYVAEVIADADCGSDTCYFAFDVVIGETAEIACPLEPIIIDLCQAQEICIPLDISPAGAEVITSFGTYADGQLCFFADTSGIYNIEVIAHESCGSDTCQLVVEVTIGEAPQITCPIDPIDVFVCDPGEFCFDLFYSPDNAVITASYGTIINGQLCFMIDTSGQYNIEVIATTDCGVDTCNIQFNVEVGEGPHIVCPESQSTVVCGAFIEEVPVAVMPADAVVSVYPMGSYDPNTGTISFDVDTAGVYEITVIAEAECGADTCHFTMTYDFNEPPIITKGDTSLFVCELAEYYSYDLTLYDPEMSPTYYYLLSSFGQIDSIYGLITFSPDTAGSYCFEVMIKDNCGAADTSEICVTIGINSPPEVVSAPDTSLTACVLEEICFPVDIYDVDDNILSIETNYGVYNAGQVCFTPVSGGEYHIITTVHDSCGAVASDTTVVNVSYIEPFEISCANDTSIFICEPDTICIEVGDIPEGVKVMTWPFSTWYDAENGTVCFYTNCSINYRIRVYAGNECFMDSCIFNVSVTMNSNPLVIMPPDTSITLCGPEEICLPVGISDMDNNISNINVSPSGYYNDVTGKICFMPDTSGTYKIVVTANDDCGGTDSDSTFITVELNDSPVVEIQPDSTIFLCTPSEICIPVSLFDPNGIITNIIVAPSGYFDSLNQRVCFTPDSAGIYMISVSVIDDCGAQSADSIMVTVKLNSSPLVISSPDSTVYMCEPSTVCFPVTLEDADDNITDITVSGGGTYSAGYVCFDPSGTGDYEFIIEAVDDCGEKASDTTVITVDINTAPVVEAASDFEAFQCVFEEICVGVDISDIDGNIQTVSANIGYYDSVNNRVCFTPADTGNYQIIITATDSCYAVGIDTVNVMVTTGEQAQFLNCPVEPVNISLCIGDSVDYTLEYTPEYASISTSHGIFADGILKFYPDTSGIYVIDVIADADCGSDTCTLVFNIEIGDVPTVVCPADTVIELCGAGMICLPVSISPAEALVSINPIGNYQDGIICFDVDSAGHYELAVTATTDCGFDSCSFAVDISFNSAPEIVTADSSFFACQPGTMLLFVQADDPESDDITFSLLDGMGVIDPVSGTISFDVDTAGRYCFMVEAADICGADTAEICMVVDMNTGPVVIASEDTTINLCSPSEICLETSVSDIDDNIVSVVTNFGTYSGGYVCFTPDTSGIYTLIVNVSDECDAFDTDTSVITINLNSSPEITSADDFELMLCTAEEICFDVDAFDVDGNLQAVTSSIGTYNPETKQVCFLPDTAGVYIVLLFASDSCSFLAYDTTIVTVAYGDDAALACWIDPANIFLCEPQEMCFDLEYSPVDAVLSTSVGGIVDGQLCLMFDTTGMYVAEVIADADCGSDTCYFAFDVVIGETAEIACPLEPINIGLCEAQEICIPLDISPAGAEVITSFGTYADGQLCFFADTGGIYNIEVIAHESCGSDTCQIAVEVTIGESPQVTCPIDPVDVFVCDPGEFCFDLTYSPDNAVVTASYGTIINGQLCFMIDTSGQYNIEVIATTDCGSDTCYFDFNVVIGEVAVITCPVEPINIDLCQAQEVCFPLDISPVAAEVITSFGTYADGQLCFFADTGGIYNIEVIAHESCGSDTCQIAVEVTIGESPQITCPIDPVDVFVCDPGEFCFDLPYSPDNAVVTASYGTIINGQLCFMIDTSGQYNIEVIVTTDCGTDTCNIIFNVGFSETAQIICPENQSKWVCGPFVEEVSITIMPVDAVVSVYPAGSYDPNAGTVSFDVDTAGVYEITVIAEAECGADTCHFTMTYDFNEPPIITKGDTSLFVCELAEYYSYDLTLYDPEMSPTYYYLLSSFGQIDSIYGLITFSPDTAGSYCFEVMIKDNCGAADTSEICVTIGVNSPPEVVSAPDTSLTACVLEEICFPVAINDADDNILSVETSHGVYMDGQVCFTPVSGGEYHIITTVHDSCGAAASDTTIVNVSYMEPFEISCANDTSIFICEPDTICIEVGDIPEGVKVITWPFSTWYDADNGTVCFYTNCSINYRIRVYAGNECFMDSCIFNVSVTMNSNPLVIMPPDTSITLCGGGNICLPVGISDIDNNIVSITTSEGAEYNPITGKVCFTPAGAGQYSLKVRALDDCGGWDLDSTIVTVNLNQAPTVIAPPDFDVFLCELGETCFQIEIGDVDNNIQSIAVSPNGSCDPETGTVCFTPADTGVQHVVITAVDVCGLTASDTANINIILNTPPDVIIGPDTSAVSCGRAPICVPVIFSDVDNNIMSIDVLGAEYSDGYACLDAVTPGIYELVAIVTDSCGAVATDTAYVNIIENSSPSVTSADDFEIFQCVFEEICFDVAVSDADNNIQNISTNIGTYTIESGQVCFTPDSAGIYLVITTATDECNVAISDTTTVTVTTAPAAVIDCPDDPVEIALCEPGVVCYRMYINPAEAIVTTSLGTYFNDSLRFQADTSGIYIAEVIADAGCGSDTCLVEFWVDIGEIPEIECYAIDTSIFICEPDTVCIPLEIFPEYATVIVSPYGTCEEGLLCFYADTAGVYTLTIIAESDCGADTCVMSITVEINEPPVIEIIIGVKQEILQCVFEEICLPVIITDVDTEIDSVVVSPVGYYNPETSELCFTPDDTGTYCITVSAYDICDAMASDTACITIITGDTAKIECPEPITERICDPSQICVPLNITPETAEVTVSYGTYADGEVCFWADTAGTYEITVIASEICGSDTCVITAIIEFDEYVEITCPDIVISASLCGSGDVSVLVPITPASASIQILPYGTYDFGTKMLTFYADTSGQYVITVIAETPCDVDTCVVTVNVTINVPPQVICPENIDTLVCPGDITEICFDVEIIGIGVTVEVLPEGTYSGGMVCVPVGEAGTITTSIIASSICGADTCQVDINITANQTPELNVPQALSIPWCEDDSGTLCIEGIFATDFENDPLTITQVCGPGTFNAVTDDSGEVCFEPVRTDTTYEFCFEVTDGCSTELKTFTAELYQSPSCSLCVTVSIETDTCVTVGTRVPVYITAQTDDPVGGFDLLISYDASVMTFAEAHQGSAISGWEYFTYRLGDVGACGGCPSGIIRLVGIADINDGPNHPPQEQLMPQGALAELRMLVANDQNLGGLFLPINFWWYDCGDNSFAEPAGTRLFVDSKIYNAFGVLIWDEANNILFPDAARPKGLGVADSCLIGDKIVPIRCVQFHNGGICVKHPDSIDARGDMNLNGVAYEIADAIVYTNYFIYGLAAFTVNVDGQIAASDINADGYTLTIADLVYLIRVIIGDADIIPKVPAGMQQIRLSVRETENCLDVYAETDCPAGAGLLVFEHDGIIPEDPIIGRLAEGMDVIYSVTDSEIRVLIYSFEAGRSIEIGSDNILSIRHNGSGSIRLVESSFATYHGELMRSSIDANLLPSAYNVSQNYPNPFNPITTIDLTMPYAGPWELIIHNINGQVVRRISGEAGGPGVIHISWDGRADDGQAVASGIYFYTVKSGEFSITRKMSLLK